jgi:hypothetical protein
MGTGSATCIRFCVSVPVLSEQKTSTPADSSIADRRETMAWWRARLTAPTEAVRPTASRIFSLARCAMTCA